MTNQITMVFHIKDAKAAAAFWEAHKNGTPIHGVVPETMAWGDQHTVPNQIVDELLELIPEVPDPHTIRRLYKAAHNYRETIKLSGPKP